MSTGRALSGAGRVVAPILVLLACLLPLQAATADDHGGQGGTVTVVVPSDDGTVLSLDPTASWSTFSTAILQGLVARSLTTYTTDPQTGKRTLVPDLATDLGRHNKDFTQWRFTLRKGVRFETGRTVTPADVRFGILRSFDGNNGTRKGGLAGPGIEYSARFFLKGRGYNGPYSAQHTRYPGVSVAGRTITIRMSQPFTEMPQWASFPAIGPMPSGARGKPRAYATHPLATGPYRVASFEPGRRLVLVRNPAWSAASDPTRTAGPDQWVFRFGQDPASADALLLSDAYDARRVILASLLPQSVAGARTLLGDQVVRLPAPCGTYAALDQKHFADVRVRRAIAYAYPREQAWLASGEIPGLTRTAGDALLPPGVPGRRDVRLDHGRHVHHDPARARRLLKAAGVKPTSVLLSWAYDARDPQARARAQVVARAFRGVGFKAEPVAYPGTTDDLLHDAAAGKPRARRIVKRTSMETISFCADWPSGSTFLPALLRRTSPFNPSGFTAPGVDADIRRILALPESKALPAWGRLDERLQERRLAMFPTGYVTGFAAMGRDLGGLVSDERGTPDFRGVYVKSD